MARVKSKPLPADDKVVPPEVLKRLRAERAQKAAREGTILNGATNVEAS